ncbi:trypsin-like peptidase domain-containing protein [Leifsonia shinshuensis]|uniref:S1C family serine protease n=1 Tax=Leifsonia shinshuensis TaxID=150026 RepID=UPI001F509439|nr:trypsin-like peptidase domain-containing protein [Leifsonia shinshuensis]MCI0156278.1 trypsin-like peptidase domain-containing protein [Leifsonia shinshuensis]
MSDREPTPLATTPPAGPPAEPGRPAPPQNRPRRTGWLWGALAVVIALVIGGALGWGIGRSGAATTAAVSSSTSGQQVSACDAITVSDDVLPAIVTVSAIGSAGGGTGTGELITSDGYIVTNNHVISGAVDGGTISVVSSGGVESPAQLVGRDPRSDLAVLKISGSNLPTVPWGDSAKVVVGQPVVALGAPLGLSGTVTSGIVSALGRTVPVPGDDGQTAILANSIQTDASINPGNSGGALVNCSGDLIGINSAIATVPNAAGQAGGGSVGIGFAIPSDFAHTIVDQLIKNGHVTYPYFGLSVAPIPPAAAQRLKVTDGLYVVSVVPGGPSAQAGLRQGDVITEIDGKPAANADTLAQTVMTTKAGESVDVTYVRDGQTAKATVTLENPPS